MQAIHFAALVAVLVAGCDDVRIPRDPDGTLDAVLASGTMTVAAVDSVPWVRVEGDGAPSGAEVDLVEAFAEELGVTVEWRRLSAFAAFQGLEQGELDLAVGGFTRNAVSPHGGVAPTFGYYREALLVGARPGAAVPEDLDGREVFVPPDVLAADLIRRRGGVPVADASPEVALVAAPDWRLEPLGLVPTGIVLRREEHVLAIPQGENAWIMRLERFLRRSAAGQEERLREHL